MRESFRGRSRDCHVTFINWVHAFAATAQPGTSDSRFHRRVLAQAQPTTMPLLERRYICIVSSNLDGVLKCLCRPVGSRELTHRSSGVAIAAHALIDEQYGIFNEAVMPALAAQGIVIPEPRGSQRGPAPLGGALLRARVRPLLMPVSLDPAHPSRRWRTSRCTSSCGCRAGRAGARHAHRHRQRCRVLPRVIRKLPPGCRTDARPLCC